MLSRLPPVRRAVPLQRQKAATSHLMVDYFGGRPVRLYGSGTAALARAITECAARSSARNPEVILPAYGCPDLVAACVQASVLPRLVDLEPAAWKYQRDALVAAMSKETVAVIAVNLLGLGDDAAGIVRQCSERRIPVIQDSAQSLPRAAGEWPGDYVVLSFGRGKPMNLLCGGALVGPRGTRIDLSLPPVHPRRSRPMCASRLAAVAFNVLTRPHVYSLLAILPGTGLGQVVYSPLRDPAPVPENTWAMVSPAFDLYRREQSYSRAIWASALAEWPRFGIEALTCPGTCPHPEPLRLALIAPDRNARESLLARLNARGLGATRFYGTSLPRVTGIPEIVQRQGPFPNATMLADRLFTLPTHSLVTSNAVASARNVISDWYRSIHPL